MGPLTVAFTSDTAEIVDVFQHLFAGFEPPSITAQDSESRTTIDVTSSGEADRFTASSQRGGADPVVICRSTDRHRLALAVTRHLNRQVLDAEGDHLHLHAGAVSRDQSTVLVIGSSFAGKSTLVAKLVDQGWSYLSDEQVGVNRAGELLSFPRPITLRSASWQFFDRGLFPTNHDRAFDRVEVGPTSLGSIYRGPALSPTVVICPNVSVESSSCTALSTADTLARLLSESFDMERASDAGIDAMVHIAVHAPGFEVAGQDLEHTVRTISELCETTTPPGAPVEQAVVPRTEANGRAPGTLSWLFADGSAALYEPVDGSLVQLDEAGFRAWQLLGADPATWPDGMAESAFVDELREIGLVLPLTGGATR